MPEQEFIHKLHFIWHHTQLFIGYFIYICKWPLCSAPPTPFIDKLVLLHCVQECEKQDSISTNSSYIKTGIEWDNVCKGGVTTDASIVDYNYNNNNEQIDRCQSVVAHQVQWPSGMFTLEGFWEWATFVSCAAYTMVGMSVNRVVFWVCVTYDIGIWGTS